MRDILKQVPVTTIILIYLFCCGGIYLMAYWSKFDMDISNMVSISEIPKSFMMPFAISNGFYFINILVNICSSIGEKKERNPESNQDLGHINSFWKRLLLFMVSIDGLIMISIPIILLAFGRFEDTSTFWLITACGFALLVSVKLTRLPFVKNAIPYSNIRTYLIQLIVFTPAMCLGLGRAKAIDTYKNINIKYIKIIKTNSAIERNANLDTVSLKLLGFLGNKIIVSSLDNKRIIIFNQDVAKQIELQKK